MSGAFFRANVGACVVHVSNNILALKRKGVHENAWQMPQGGIESDEDPRTAVFRELQEETGLSPSDVEIITEYPEWLVYELPVTYRNTKVGWGQAQKWFILRITSTAVPKPDGNEFEDYAWLTPTALLPLVVDFRRNVYERVFALMAAHRGLK